MKLNLLIASVLFVCILLPAFSFAQNKVVVIPLFYSENTAPGITWQGEWQPDKAYQRGDGVQHEGSSYICAISHRSETSNAPPDQSNWDLIASKGETGPQGEQGPPDGWGLEHYTVHSGPDNERCLSNISRSICFLTTVRVQETDHPDEEAGCILSRGDAGSCGGYWRLFAFVESGDASAWCEATCMIFLDE